MLDFKDRVYMEIKRMAIDYFDFFVIHIYALFG